jgi:putative chitinase
MVQKNTFGKYFPGNLADQYARQPEKIANRVYASRMGNGNEASGDGWKYR